MPVATSAPITATVAGKTYELVPTIQAVRAINAAFGGLRPALTAIQSLNWDAAAQVIAAGSLKPMKNKAVQALGEALWADDARAEATGAAVDFLVLLMNGGKAPTEDDDTDGEDQDPDTGNA